MNGVLVTQQRTRFFRPDSIFSVLIFITFLSPAFAEFLTRRNATVGAIDPKFKVVTFLVEPKARTAKAGPEKHSLCITSEIVFRQLPGRRKIQATFAEIQIGQSVILSGISSTSISSNLATEIIILPTKTK